MHCYLLFERDAADMGYRRDGMATLLPLVIYMQKQ